MKSVLMIWISLISILDFSRSLQTHSCLEEYLTELYLVNKNYLLALEECEDKDNIFRQPPQDLKPEVEIEFHRQTSQETCYNLMNCSTLKDAHDYFRCHSDTAYVNMQKFALMNLNASSVVFELSDEFDAEEKELRRCHLAAKQKYMMDSFTVYSEHLKCLSSNIK